MSAKRQQRLVLVSLVARGGQVELGAMSAPCCVLPGRCHSNTTASRMKDAILGTTVIRSVELLAERPIRGFPMALTVPSATFRMRSKRKTEVNAT
jgi:hypothetical protein